MFGAQVGAAAERFGAIGMQGANELAAQAVARQQLQNQIVSDQAQSTYVKGANAILLGDPKAAPGDPAATGFYGLHGQDAIGAGAAVSKALDDLEEKVRAGLTNPRQVIDFNQYTRRFRAYTDTDIGRHLDAETHAWGAEVQKGNEVLALQNAGLYYLDPVRVGAELANGEQAVVRGAQNLGAAPDSPITQAKIGEFHNAFAATIVDRYLANNNPAGAQAWLAGHGGLVTNSATAEQLQGRIKSGLVQQGSREITAGVMTGGVSRGPVSVDQVTQAAIEKGVDPALANATASIESSHGANTGNKVSPSNTGVYQMAPANAPGGANDTLQNQVALGVGKLAEERDDLRTRLGREPTNAEVYLAHQQGPTGAAKLINNPTTPAGQLLPPVNISNNGGDPNASASVFVQHWQQVYNQHEGRFQGAPAAGGAPTLEQLETDGRAQVTAYAARNGLDPDTTQQLTDQTLSRIRTQYNVSAAALRSTEQTNRTVAQAQVIAGNNGEPFHSLDDYLAEPGRRQLYDSLKPADQLALGRQIETASTHVPLTPERLQRFSELHGMSITDPAGFMQVDPLKEDLPVGMKKQLISMRDQIERGVQAPFDTIKALTVIKGAGLLDNTGIDPKNNPPLYHQFTSALADAGTQFKAEHKRPPNTEEIRGIASDLLKTVIPGAWWNPFSSDTRAFETMVPASERNDIVKAYQTQFGRAPTPNQILQIYHYQQEKGAGPNQATAEQPEGVTVP